MKRQGMSNVAIVGIGHAKFGVRTDVTVSELAWEAIRLALEDARLKPKEIDFCVVGSGFSSLSYEEMLPAVAVTEYANMVPTGHVRCESACATGSAAVHIGYMRIASGLSDTVLVVGVEKMTEVDTPTMVELIARAGSYLWEYENFGLTFPGYYALLATHHMAKFGTTAEDLARVAVKNHHYGRINENAYLRNEITIEDVLASRPIAWPNKFLDCCPINDGSAALILASEERAKEIARNTKKPLIWIKGLGAAGDTAYIGARRDLFSIRSTEIASQKAYKMAGISPGDLDVVTVHDCFTIGEILAYEDLGFCRKGEGARVIREKQTYHDGRIPTNVDGGLKAKGHPIGATGCSMVYEIAKQLRQEVEKERQVRIRKGWGMAHNVGGTGHSCYVTILGRE
jgi:acetyl-CoA C-acetyltransferase